MPSHQKWCWALSNMNVISIHKQAFPEYENEANTKRNLLLYHSSFPHHHTPWYPIKCQSAMTGVCLMLEEQLVVTGLTVVWSATQIFIVTVWVTDNFLAKNWSSIIRELSQYKDGMTWCHQATSHYICWPRSMSPYGITLPQWVYTPELLSSIIYLH